MASAVATRAAARAVDHPAWDAAAPVAEAEVDSVVGVQEVAAAAVVVVVAAEVVVAGGSQFTKGRNNYEIDNLRRKTLDRYDHRGHARPVVFAASSTAYSKRARKRGRGLASRQLKRLSMPCWLQPRSMTKDTSGDPRSRQLRHHSYW